MGTFRYLDHTADLCFEIIGNTLEDLFVTTGNAIFSHQIKGELVHKKSYSLDLSSDSLEDLLIDWCRELLYLFSVHGFIPFTYNMTIKDIHIQAHIDGDILDNERHEIKSEIKNATYHYLMVKKQLNGYHATIVFDV